MGDIAVIAGKVVAIMTVFLIVWLAMGKRQLGELTPLDFAVSITVGAIAGAAIIDPRIRLVEAIAAIVLLGSLQMTLSWLSLKIRALHNQLNFQPTVLVENGQIIKGNLRKARLPAEMLLQLLREKEVFDITEVELAVLEPHSKLSVLKKAEFLPLTPNRMKIPVNPNNILLPVILEGELKEQILQKMGFSREQIAAFKAQYEASLPEVFVAFMDQKHQLHIIKEDVEETGIFLH